MASPQDNLSSQHYRIPSGVDCGLRCAQSDGCYMTAATVWRQDMTRNTVASIAQISKAISEV
jgi:hypothetical protein